MTLSSRILTALAVAALAATACKSSAPATGEFQALTSNMSNGDIWALNRPIQLVFNNEIDPLSVNFSSVIIRASDPQSQGSPVAGSFTLGADSEGRPGRVITFLPVCPTNANNDNGSFRPGGIGYELLLPTQQTSATVLRDTAGHALGVGLTRTFVTPTPPTEPLFADTVNGPPQITGITWPVTLNLFSQDRDFIRVRFNQSVDASPSSLNLTNLFVQYSNAGGAFPGSGNVVPGAWIVSTNCSDDAELLFKITGVLVPSRGLRVVMTGDFLDLGGDGNTSIVNSDAFLLPALGDLLALPGFDEDNVALDEFADQFLNASNLDLAADLPQPPATILPDRISAAFEYPGDTVTADEDFVLTAAQAFLEIDTTGVTQVTDGLGRVFTCTNGVMNVNDFTIQAGATLRLRGGNPFLLHASGIVTLLGTLDATGFHAQRPDGGRFHPEIPVIGALGVLGGGQGGTSSQITNNFTPRGETGDGPFGLTGLGGQGGEGAVQQSNGLDFDDVPFFISGGGGGGGFASSRTDSIFWTKWVAGVDTPPDHDDAGPDLRKAKHTIFNATINADTFFVGAEAGLRGSNKDGPYPGTPGNTAQAPYGMEDIQQDDDAAADTDDVFDPAQTGATITFRYGNPTFGPDPGAAGPGVFSDSLPANDFYGNRYFWSGTGGTVPELVEGELLSPWAGAGGGASGDTQRVERLDLTQPPDGILEPLPMFFPDILFPYGSTTDYWRGAPGGGGGGQVQILAVGKIVIGSAGRVKANGGNGSSGESSDESSGNSTITQISGSGGGSGGHVILQSATGVDLSAISVGTAGNPNVPATFFNNLVAADVVQAFGGRRGWSAANQAADLAGAPGSRDGNSTFMAGRGGAGASGVVQIHVPDPVNDFTFHPTVNTAFKQYMNGVNTANPVISDRLDALLGLYGEPRPFGLVPTYSPQTQAQSIWIDTGLAEVRAPANGVGPFPDYAHSLGAFSGVAGATGIANQTGDMLTPGANVASDGGAGTATISDFEMSVASASGSFPDVLLGNPVLLIGFDVVPNTAQLPVASSFEIVSATYDSATDVMLIGTRASDGPMSAVASLSWAVRAKYFRIDTAGVKDGLPAASAVRFQFQGAEAIAGTNTLDPASITAWTGDGVTTMSTLKGKRFIRWRLTFDLDVASAGTALTADVPTLDYLKLPFAW